ncbi:glycosyl hydrolase family 18 protein [Yersinia pseudotuberculosis]|uniref:glycosyl hydrolase family 18 protein n=1 Tax=Yersinia pseudotuberculosis TaxID=633 RepID=UPI00061C3781|nr:glycosyl hydrolase family 18 protein [Yersinia pseudotuberculosis]BET61170.1 glycosyl hydrolase family 18 protein [Yersinia pseudotuberculosis]CNL65941.1 glycosyl hydrolase family protein [Yersinia pseudotuberculosis]
MSKKNSKKSPVQRVDIKDKKIFMGFWHNWPSYPRNGYKYGQSTNIPLADIPKEFNVIAVAFMKGSGIPTFRPYIGSDEQFRTQVDKLHSEGRSVLISLGGADAEISLTSQDEAAFVAEIKRLVDVYGFDGLDIDLEQAAISYKENSTVIPRALKTVKDYYANLGQHFIISMAPEFPHLRINEAYVPYIKALEGYYDFIAPQYYNQLGDGVHTDSGEFIAQSNNERKEDFLYYLTKHLVSSSQTFINIPANKFVMGLPANNDAADNGYVIDKKDVHNAFARLDAAGLSIRGLMTWSIDWDNGKDVQGKSYNWEFKTRYASLGNNDDGSSNNNLPLAPYNLIQTSKAANSLELSWQHTLNVNAISYYSIFRDGNKVGISANTTFTDTGLEPNKQYIYKVSATDSQGQISDFSTVVTATTLTTNLSVWEKGQWYNDNDSVRHNAENYICVMQHTSNAFWSPDQATTLWQLAVQR